MALTLSTGGSGEDFKRAPAGSHIGVCNMVADCGMQPGSAQFPKPKRKLYIRFEIPSERVEYEKDGHKVEGPLTIGSFYTASMNEKAVLRKHLEGWRGKSFTDAADAEQFDIAKILGKACMLSVIENEKGGKTYSNIAGIGKVPKGIPEPVAENPLLYFAPDDESQFDQLPKWLQEKIEAAIVPAKPNASESHGSSDFHDDEVNF